MPSIWISLQIALIVTVLTHRDVTPHLLNLRRSTLTGAMIEAALPLIIETSKILLKDTIKQKETIKRPFIKRKETFDFFMWYLDKMEENCGKNVHCGYFYQLSKCNIYRSTKLY